MSFDREDMETRKKIISGSKTIVVKVGSRVLTSPHLGLKAEFFNNLSEDIARIMKTDRQVVIVSSGAIAAGMGKLGLTQRPKSIPESQAAAAVGQGRLINEYEERFRKHGITVAQMLLTHDDFRNRRRFLNARHALETLLDYKVVTIINENDSVVVKEIMLGDNDNLCALVTTLIVADLLIILTNTDGLYDRDPALEGARLIPTVEHIDFSIEVMAGACNDNISRGGMASKLQAAKKATMYGVPTIIANGNIPEILSRIFSAEPLGTLFLPQKDRLTSRKHWIAFTLKPTGALILDDGACSAIKRGGKSLLPSGIISTEGRFEKGESVTLKGARCGEFARGLVNYNFEEVELIKGLQSSEIEAKLGYKVYDEIIHRDDLVLLDNEA